MCDLYKINTYEWYNKRIYKLPSDYSPTDQLKAFEVSLEWGDKIPIGILYRKEKPLHEDQIPIIFKKPLVDQAVNFDSLKEKIHDILKAFY